MYAEWDKNCTEVCIVSGHYSCSGFRWHQANSDPATHRLHLDQSEQSLQQSRLDRPVAFLYDFHTQWISFLVTCSINSNWIDHKEFWERNLNGRYRHGLLVSSISEAVFCEVYLSWDFSRKTKLLLGQGVKAQKSYCIKSQNRWNQSLYLHWSDNGHA